jgi:methanogenic corrinoid protein MtbC1
VNAHDLSAIEQAVAALDEARTLRLVEQAKEAGHDPVELIHAVQDGLAGVGERYEQGEIYLAGLIMAGEIFRGAMEIVQPGLEVAMAGADSGRVLLGTVAGDIHDIGKNMAALAFRMRGCAVVDLGVNVPPEKFVEAALQFRPDIVGMSGLLVVAFEAMRETIDLLRQQAPGPTKTPLLVIGGGTVNEQVAHYVGADLWSDDAMEGARQCLLALETRR